MNQRMQLLLSVMTALLIVAGPMSQLSQAKEDKPKTVTISSNADQANSIFTNDIQKLSYVIGSQIGQSFKAQKMEIDLVLFLKGIKDTLAGKEPALSQEQQKQVMTDFRQKQVEKRKKQAEENQAKSKEFLEKNKSKKGVVELPSGLQYKIITKGTGATPTAQDKVKTHYRGTLANGEEFDSSYKRGKPAEFAVTGVIKGWTEALQLMKEGAKWELTIPASLAYGAQGRPNIPPNSTLVFELELLEVIKSNSTPIAPAGK